jgi:hypothetical protein
MNRNTVWYALKLAGSTEYAAVQHFPFPPDPIDFNVKASLTNAEVDKVRLVPVVPGQTDLANDIAEALQTEEAAEWLCALSPGPAVSVEVNMNDALRRDLTDLQSLALATAAEAMWCAFIERLNETKPLGNELEHRSFLGSVDLYRKVFLDANAAP